MKLQDTQANCGSLAVYNGLRALGMMRSVEELVDLLKTNATTGTSTKNLIKGVRKIDDLKGGIISEKRADVAELHLYHALRNGRPVVIVVDNDEHWVVAVGLLGHRVLIADSADEDLVVSLSKEEIMARWHCGGKKPFTGVVL